MTAETFRHTLERTLDRRMNSPAQGYWGDIVGVKAYEAGTAAHVAGIRAHGDTLSIRLTHVSGSFLARLAMPFSCAVPLDTPVDPKGVPTIPSAGPYYVASYQPGRRVLLKRNPNYHGPRPHRLDAIDVALNVNEAQAIKDVEAGKADYVTLFESPRSETARLAARYGPSSPLGHAGRQQYFLQPFLANQFLVLNTTRPLFASARMRRAVNFAVDRRALADAQTSFGRYVALPTDQYLPPGMNGFRDATIYPLDGPDVARARRLAGRQRRTAVLLTGNGVDTMARARILVRNLAAIGIHVRHKALSPDAFNARVAKKGEWDIAGGGWITDGYYDPFNFLNIFFDGNLRSTIGLGFAGILNDQVYNRRLEAAEKLTGPARYNTYARLDADLARTAAPFIATNTGSRQDFFSARMGCQQPLAGDSIDLAALCIQG